MRSKRARAHSIRGKVSSKLSATKCFHKLVSQIVSALALRFSMMTTTRSLDLAAENEAMPQCGKDALYMLLVEAVPEYSGPWRIYAEINPSGTTLSKISFPCRSQRVQEEYVRYVASSRVERGKRRGLLAEPKPLRKEAIKKQCVAAARQLESMFPAVSPRILWMNKSDTLMVACQIGNATLRLCLQYGAKNDLLTPILRDGVTRCMSVSTRSCTGHPSPHSSMLII